MFQLHRADRRVNGQTLRPIVRLLIFTIPVWLCLFIVFPRFTLKLFRTKATVQATGFSEGLDPGSVSGLAQSNEVAFRVKFQNGSRRNPETLYWRGATLYDGKGLKWSPRPEAQTRIGSIPVADLKPRSAQDLSYEVITDSGNGLALFTLPRVTSFTPGEVISLLHPFFSSDGIIRLSMSRRDHVSYTATAIPEIDAEPETLTAEMFRRTLQVPDDPSPEYISLVNELNDHTTNVHQAMGKIDAWLLDNDFRYTLSPADAKGTSIDNFLFTNRSGFCEHYAATTATLLRSMGFNARVVVGYQGGKWNTVSNAFIVRSRDAHAWVEVWSPIKRTSRSGRWITYDPTASIAPLRLRLGGDFLDLPEEQQKSRDGAAADQVLERLSDNLLLKAIDRSVMLWDYAQMSWTQFLLGYDQSGQRNFLNQILSWLGFTSRPWLMLGLVAVFFGIMLRLVFLWHARTPSESAVRREWEHLAKELARIGAFQSDTDGPLTIRARVSNEAVETGIDAFIALQYGQFEDASENIQMIREARRAAKKLPTQPLVQRIS
jgi:transglutaminase-like putative cysteine protease